MLTTAIVLLFFKKCFGILLRTGGLHSVEEDFDAQSQQDKSASRPNFRLRRSFSELHSKTVEHDTILGTRAVKKTLIYHIGQ